MLDWANVIGGLMVAFLVVYSLTGGADFGGGVWDLLARGQREGDQRALIKDAIGPIWEANHVWLIVLIVIFFADFPRAFALMANALHVPLTLMLFGVILRGTSFVFRTYDRARSARLWSRVFSISSILTPLMLGICLGAISSGGIAVDSQGQMTSGFYDVWPRPFPILVGCITIALFAFLAAVYLTNQAKDTDLREDFRRSALGSGIVVAVLALACLLSARSGAPRIYDGLFASAWAIPVHIATAIAAIVGFWCLWRRSFRAARIAAGAQVTLIVLGWAFAMYPYLIYPAYTVQDAIAPAPLPALTFWVLAAGSVLLVPSFVYLYRVFAR